MLKIGSDTNTLFGCAIHPRWFGNEVNNEDTITEIPTYSKYLSTICEHFNAIVIEHHMKWGPILSNDIRGLYDFTQCDIIVNWAISQNIVIKGHVLIWHVTSPQYLSDLKPSELREELKKHIFIMMKHFKGRIKYWDVVNEALAPNGKLAENIFLKQLGPSYIDDCFRWAHEADPDAILIYNDNKVESARISSNINESSDTNINDMSADSITKSVSKSTSVPMENNYYEKSDAFYELVKGMIERGVPLHHVGIQAHFNAGAIGKGRIPTPIEFENQINRLSDLGLSVNISEFDIRVSKLKKYFYNDEDEWEWRLAVQEQITRKLLHCCYKMGMKNKSFLGVWWWGVHDLSSWCHKFYFPGDRPLLLDNNFQRKPAYNGVIHAFSDENCNDKWGIVDGLNWLPNEIDVPEELINSTTPIDHNSDNCITNAINITADMSTAKPDWEL